MTVQWKPVPGHEKIYEVSSEGVVRSLARVVRVAVSAQSRNGYNRPVRERILKPVLSNGYQFVCLWSNHIPRQVSVHVLVAEAFIGNRPSGYYVCHRDGNRANNKLDNIYYGTPSDNVEDMRRHGTMAVGENAGAAKLSTADVEVILELRGKVSQSVLARRFGVRQPQISRIQAGVRWARPGKSEAARA